MIQGKENISHFTEELQAAGGSTNAATSQDTTDYHTMEPAVNLGVAFWLTRNRIKGPLVIICVSLDGGVWRKGIFTKVFV